MIAETLLYLAGGAACLGAWSAAEKLLNDARAERGQRRRRAERERLRAGRLPDYGAILARETREKRLAAGARRAARWMP